MALQSTWPWSVISCLRMVLLHLFQRRKKRSHWSLGRAAKIQEAPQGPFLHSYIGLSQILTSGLLQQSHHCLGSLHSPSGACPSRTKSLLAAMMSPHHDIHCSFLAALLSLPLTVPPTQVLCFSWMQEKGQEVKCCVGFVDTAYKYNLSSATILLFKGRQPTISS